MKKTSWQLQNAKNRFSELVTRALRGEPQMVTKNGKPAVFVIDVETYQARIAKAPRSKKSILLNRPHKDVALRVRRDKDGGRDTDL